MTDFLMGWAFAVVAYALGSWHGFTQGSDLYWKSMKRNVEEKAALRDRIAALERTLKEQEASK